LALPIEYTEKITAVKTTLRDALLNGLRADKKVELHEYMALAHHIFQERAANDVSHKLCCPIGCAYWEN
jgi:hypothetical protein